MICHNRHGSFSPHVKITDAFRHFGITDKTTSLIAVKVGGASEPATTRETVSDHLRAHVQGTLLPFKDEFLFAVSDVAKIRKLYRIASADGGGKGGKKKAGGAGEAAGGTSAATAGRASVEERAEMEAVVLGIMATKGA